MTKTKGAKEEGWGEGGRINFQSGCRGGCEYCYARWGECKRLPLFIKADPVLLRRNWMAWVNNQVIRDLSRFYGKPKTFDGAVMFPTTHDLDQKNLYEAEVVLKWLLKGRNKVRIVSKADPVCFEHLQTVSDHFTDAQTDWRTTLGSLNEQFWSIFEKGTPRPTIRVDAIRKTAEVGRYASVSMEPFAKDFLEVWEAVYDYAQVIWIGPMNHVDQMQVFWTQPLKIYYYKHLAPLYERQNLLKIVKILQEQDYKKKLRLKDTMPVAGSGDIQEFLK